MKLVIKETCVVAGGKIAERGQVYSTKTDDKANDKEAYDLIASGRAVTADSKEGQAFLDKVAEAEKAKAEAAKAEAAKKK